eukprot:CAMPEP_0170993760 /NCGR_PEP_ID=MMETSP0736-20130129/10537_1 /TAXON_ID=186038 /ORGANISM="Fragilariopsis kerguelensis, Strain L26-C5" /LENGTH=274 /DNA_ID=CAMNT_0011419483 /DNA_START=130 /DNA_END=957 /DNA_ORIENTATION=+
MDRNNDNDMDTNDDNNGHVSAVPTVAVAVAVAPIDGNSTSRICCRSTTVVDDDTARLFFQEQHDLVSEIFSFLDVQSLLLLCTCSSTTRSTTNDNKTAVPLSSILRYDHIIQSALSLLSSSSLSSPYTNRSVATKIIMQKLLQVFHINNNNTDEDDDAMTTTTTKFNCKFKLTPPSPLRLLRLVNGRKCEKCQCRLFPTVLATTTTRHSNDKNKMCDSDSTGSSHSGIILPSLSFGRFCCTQCIFENAMIPSPSQSQSSILRTSTPLRSSPAVQ